MQDYENLYDKIRELIGDNPDNVNILEENVDVELQVEYFEFSKRIAKEYDEGWAIEQAEMLHDPDFSEEGKRQILARLASIEDVDAYRAIEAYYKDPDPELKEWAILALQESRMHIESHLLDQNQVFISTGLGGKGSKLRYFVVLISRNNNELTEFQKDIIEKEFPFSLEKYESEIETYDSSGYLATFQLLIPIQYSVKQLFTEAIEECNQFGDFLSDDCIVTNVKRLTFKEITDFIEQKAQ